MELNSIANEFWSSYNLFYSIIPGIFFFLVLFSSITTSVLVRNYFLKAVVSVSIVYTVVFIIIYIIIIR